MGDSADKLWIVFEQGDTEVRLGLPVSPFGDREKHGELAKGQTAFLTFVVEPLLRELEALEASISHLNTRPVIRCVLYVKCTSTSVLARDWPHRHGQGGETS